MPVRTATGESGGLPPSTRRLLSDVSYVFESRPLFLSSLVGTDLRNKYRRSIIGLGWAFLLPLLLATLMAIVMAFLFHQPVGQYFLYVYSGFVAWEFVTASALGGGQSFITAESFMRAFAIPPVAYVIRVVAVACVGFLIAFSGVLLVAIFMQGVSWSWLSIPISLLVSCFLAFNIAIPMAFLVTRYRDSGQLLVLGFQALWYVSPVFISTAYFADNTMLSSWNSFNPIAQYLELFRAPLLYAEWPSFRAYLTVFLFGLALLAFGAMLYRRRASRVVLEL